MKRSFPRIDSGTRKTIAATASDPNFTALTSVKSILRLFFQPSITITAANAFAAATAAATAVAFAVTAAAAVIAAAALSADSTVATDATDTTDPSFQPGPSDEFPRSYEQVPPHAPH